jgi:AcrR family transcriptional regulator
MELSIQILMNERLFLRDPEATELGRRILQHGLAMMQELGLEDMTFKKLATRIGTTEASIYRYFENKHRLLAYFAMWHWSWLEYQVVFHTQNVDDPKRKLELVITLLTAGLDDGMKETKFDKKTLESVLMREGLKVFFTGQVKEDQQKQIFKPYEDFVARLANFIKDYCPTYNHPHALANTVVEVANRQPFFAKNIPALTNGKEMNTFLTQILFGVLDTFEK